MTRRQGAHLPRITSQVMLHLHALVAEVQWGVVAPSCTCLHHRTTTSQAFSRGWQQAKKDFARRGPPLSTRPSSLGIRARPQVPGLGQAHREFPVRSRQLVHLEGLEPRVPAVEVAVGGAAAMRLTDVPLAATTRPARAAHHAVHRQRPRDSLDPHVAPGQHVNPRGQVRGRAGPCVGAGARGPPTRGGPYFWTTTTGTKEVSAQTTSCTSFSP